MCESKKSVEAEKGDDEEGKRPCGWHLNRVTKLDLQSGFDAQ